MSVKFPLVAKKIDKRSYSLAGFSNYVAKTVIDRYEYICTNACGRLLCIDNFIFLQYHSIWHIVKTSVILYYHCSF